MKRRCVVFEFSSSAAPYMEIFTGSVMFVHSPLRLCLRGNFCSLVIPASLGKHVLINKQPRDAHQYGL